MCQSKDPKDNRLRVSILIQAEGKNIVIDAGPDFRQQMLRARVTHLDAIILTHEHNDHMIGVDDVRPFNFKQKEGIPVYATERVQKDLLLRFRYVFSKKKYPGAPTLELRSIFNDKPFEVKGLNFTPIELMHGNLPVLGFRIGDFTYITDARTIASEEMEKIKGSKIVILNALHYYEHYSGMMSWYGAGTNSTKEDEIPLHRAGHAPNGGHIQLKTVRHSSGTLMLMVKSTLSYSAALDNSNGGKIMRFKFRRLI